MENFKNEKQNNKNENSEFNGKMDARLKGFQLKLHLDLMDVVSKEINFPITEERFDKLKQRYLEISKLLEPMNIEEFNKFMKL